LARACLERVLRLDPEHDEARKLLAALGGTPPARKETGTLLWNRKDLSNWTGGPPWWTVRGSILRGEVREQGYWMRAKHEVTGSFVLECEMRVVENCGSLPLLEICFAASGPYRHHALWVSDHDWVLALSKTEGHHDELRKREFVLVQKGFNPSQWHTYRIEVKGRRITCYLGEKEIMNHKTPADDLGGFVGLKLQDRVVEIRRLVVRQ
jgi:hypothetical protein